MFEFLTERLNRVFQRLGGRGSLTEKDVDEALREIRLALLEADVNFKVVKSFLSRVRERCLGVAVLESLTPAQQIVKIVNEELVGVLGAGASVLTPAGSPPWAVLLVGLQGSGKTTTAAKLAHHLKQAGRRTLLVAADTRRPAAIAQLVTLGKQLDIPVHSEDPSTDPRDICLHALEVARRSETDWVIVDTQGRLHIDEALMAELAQLKVLKPAETLLVVDAMTGQEAVRIAEQFQASIGLTGLILTKMDGDARGGAALSVRFVTGVPIKFIGTGEKADALEVFHPERLASRILGMGDMLTLVEKAEKAFDKAKVESMEAKLRSARFDLEDFLTQLKEVRKLGPLAQVAEMLPGFNRLAPHLSGDEEKRLKRIEAIVLSMTPEERHNPAVLDGSRRKRIARGSGTSIQEINQLLNQFHQVQKLMKMASKGKMPRNLPGGWLQAR